MCSNLSQNACRRKKLLEMSLTSSCSVVRTTSTIDQFGAEGQANAVVATYPCRATILPAHPKNTALGDEDTVRAQWEITLPLTADVNDNDVLTIGDASYTVVDTDKGRTGALTLMARCRKDA